ncbi:hypothetical protein ABT026_27185 [Streptomyces sp. NPDC002734]|uniref:hypothetical protein n=1 Tax=Streptomyces sp. NPDC002734 TaxID=3154426 RepID=UPI00331E2ED5
MNGTNERTDVLDFPGAEQLVAAGRVAPPSAGTVRAAQQAVASAVASAAPRGGMSPVMAARRPARSRRLLVAAAAVAAIAAGAVVYPVIGVGDSRPAATAAATDFLTEMSVVAAEAPAAEDSPYWKIRYTTVNQDDGKALSTTYFDRDGNIWTVAPDGGVDRAEGKTRKWRVGDTWLTWSQLDALPADRTALEPLFADDAVTRFRQVASLLEESPASPELRSALFRILASTPGTKLVGEVRDSRGREGVAVEITAPNRYAAGTTAPRSRSVMRDRYIVDPDTGFLLEATHGSPGKQAPADRYTWLEAGPADQVK